MSIIIGGLQKVTLVDYPAKVACTVFLSGCNFRCPFCYSQELVLPESAKDHPQMDEDYFFSFLEERKGMLDGCVICGGEPTVNPELPLFLKKIKDLGYSIKLDTNGSNPEMIKRLIGEGMVDYIAMDIKAPLDQAKYRTATGADINVDKIKESVDLIKNSGIGYEFRSTVVPGIHSREDIIQMAKGIAPAKRYFLQQFRNDKETLDPSLSDINPNYPDDFLPDVEKEIKYLFTEFRIR